MRDHEVGLGPLGFATRSQSPTRFCAGALGPSALGCSPAKTRLVPPVDFCNRYDPRTHLRSSQNLDLVGADESAPIEQPSSVPAKTGPCEQGPLRGEGRPSWLSSGVAEYATPDGNDRSLRRIYPNLMDPDTSCR